MIFVKRTFLLLIVAILTVPSLQKFFELVPLKTFLEGYSEPAIRPEITLNSIRSGEYQAKITPHLEKTIGFRVEFVKLFNQCDYSFFSIPHAARMVVGNNGILQADSHIDAYTGKDFVGKMFIDDKIGRLKYLNDSVFKKKGIRLLVIFAPGKGFYFPESIPDRFLKGKGKMTNIEYTAKKIREAGIPLIDFNEYLLRMKDTATRVLYPNTGIHWSCYGAYLCADSLIRYLENNLGRKLPHMVLDSLVTEPRARKEDDDMDRVLNLYRRIPVPPMTYPVFHHVYDSAAPKPAVLFISDSFYWYWHYNGIIKNTFQREDLWYYDKEVYPEQNTKPTNTAQISLDSALNRQEVVILMATNGGYGNLGYGFIDRAYEYYYPGDTRVKTMIKGFYSSSATMKLLREKARSENLPLNAVVFNDAMYLYNTELRRISKNQTP